MSGACDCHLWSRVFDFSLFYVSFSDLIFHLVFAVLYNNIIDNNIQDVLSICSLTGKNNNTFFCSLYYIPTYLLSHLFHTVPIYYKLVIMADADVIDMLSAWGLSNYIDVFKGKLK